MRKCSGAKFGMPVNLKIFTLGEGVADLDGAVVVDADDVAGICLFHVGPVLGHEDGGIGDLHVPSESDVPDLHAAGEFAGTDAEKGDPVPMGRVHVRLDLEDEAGERFLVG